MKALVIGLGIGGLYHKVLTELGYDVITVDTDSNKSPDYTSVTDIQDMKFDLAYIGTPNLTHEPLARSVASFSKIVLIEKPGVVTSDSWKQLISDFPDTRFAMVKNNQYRDEINEFQNLYTKAEHVVVCWHRKNCVPHPGSWFTSKEKAFGGVSRDLMPHMLSYYTTLTEFDKGTTLFASAKQQHTLDSITDTEYGAINREGVYDVDDFCEIIIDNNSEWKLTANWKTDQTDDSSITFVINGEKIRFELGWCPEEAYKKMLIDMTEHSDNDKFWDNQNKQDIWIHEQIEKL